MLAKSGMKPLDTDPKSSDSPDTQPSQRGTEDWATDTESIDLEALVTVSGTAWAADKAEEADDMVLTWADRVANQEQQLLSQSSSQDFVIQHGMQTKRSQGCGHGQGWPLLRGNPNVRTPDNHNDYNPNFDTPTMQHKAEVAPVFLVYNRVSSEGQLISLIQIATSVYQALSDSSAVDAIQPMRTGWCIYVQSITDRQTLINKGIVVAGKYVALRSEYRSAQKKSVKIILKYLPLHSVGNEDVLESVKEYCEVLSMVNYSNIWHNGHITNICNGDRFVYIAATDLEKVPDQIDVGEYRA